MTKDELTMAFNAECMGWDKSGNYVVICTPTDIINWIAVKFCTDYNPSPFSKAFTGMMDKNGTPIHEGAHVRLYYKGDYVICQVVYDIKRAAFFIKWPDGYVNQYFMNGNNYEVVEVNRVN